MKLCDLSFPTPQENLACDEALLDEAEVGRGGELLRFWEPIQHFVVVGYGNKVSTEVNQDYCGRHSIPVLRRCTGGGTVLQGPGVLNYTLILQAESPPFQTIASSNQEIMKRHQEALAAMLAARVEIHGFTDLAIGGLKFSGNAQRRKKRFLIFHGSLLLHLDIALVEDALLMPSKQPEYRLNRSHADFLMNLKVPSERVKLALSRIWNACEKTADPPLAQTARLVKEKYSREDWNSKF